MNRQQLFEQIQQKQSFLCVGLDSDINKIPEHLLDNEDPIYAFNKAIVDATAPFCVAYKPNVAFYESMGVQGWLALEKTVAYIRQRYPQQFIIADAKRGDIGNTSEMYARTFFDRMKVDALTVAPYMGEDSVKPFLLHQERWVILLALTSNKGSEDFQLTIDREGESLFAKVPDHFLLVPGVGAQGGSLEEVCRYGMNSQCGLLVNSSRNIIYADSGEDFASAAAGEARKLQLEMQLMLGKHVG